MATTTPTLPYPTPNTGGDYSDWVNLPALPTPLPTVKPNLNDQGSLYNVPNGQSYSAYNKGYVTGSPSYAPTSAPTLNKGFPSAVFSKPPELYDTATLKAVSLFNKYSSTNTNLTNLTNSTVATNDISQIQTNLGYLGYYKGKVDGQVNDQLRSAYEKWVKDSNGKFDSRLSSADNFFTKDESGTGVNSKLAKEAAGIMDKQVFEKEQANGFKSIVKGATGQAPYSLAAKKQFIDALRTQKVNLRNGLASFFGGDLRKVEIAASVNDLLSNGMKDAKSFESMLGGLNTILSESQYTPSKNPLGGSVNTMGVSGPEGLYNELAEARRPMSTLEEKQFALEQAGEQLRTLMATDSDFARAVEGYLQDNDELQAEFINIAGCSGARPPAPQDTGPVNPLGGSVNTMGVSGPAGLANQNAQAASSYMRSITTGNTTAGSNVMGVAGPAGFTGGAEPPVTGVLSSSQIDGIPRGSGQNPGNSFADPANAGNTSQIDQEKTNDVTEKAQEEAKKENKKKGIENKCSPGVVNVTQLHAVTGKLSPTGVLCEDSKMTAVQYCQRAKEKKNVTRTGKTSTGRNTTGGSRKGISNMNPLNALKSALGRGFPGKSNGSGVTEEDIRNSFKADPLEVLRQYYEDFANSLGGKSVLEVLYPELYALSSGGSFANIGTQKQMIETYLEYVGAFLTDENTIDLRKLFVLLYFGSLTFDQFLELDGNIARLYFEFLTICEDQGLTTQVNEDIDVDQIAEITLNAMKTLTGAFFNFVNTDLSEYDNQLIIPKPQNRVEVIQGLTNVIKQHLEVYGRFYTIRLFSTLMFSNPDQSEKIVNDDTLKQMYFDFRRALEANGFDEDQTYTATEYTDFVVPAFESIFG